MKNSIQILHRIPEELLQDVIEQLDKRDLTCLNLTSRFLQQKATPLIWRNVDLRDCRTVHEDDLDDHHDDTPLLRKLLVLATNPWVASFVNTLTHSCHLPPPSIFNELQRTPFGGETLSPDLRTAKLVQLAVKNMSNVQTLRIIFGHPNINDILLRCFFDKNRSYDVRRLWLENCRINVGCSIQQINHPLQLPFELHFAGLESIRFRRLPLRPALSLDRKFPFTNYVHARGGMSVEMADAVGGSYFTTINEIGRELDANNLSLQDKLLPYNEEIDSIETCLESANICDDRIYEALAEQMKLPAEVVTCHIKSYFERSKLANRGVWLDPDPSQLQQEPIEYQRTQREVQPASRVMLDLLNSCSCTLTSLCLDWVLTAPYDKDLAAWSKTFLDLFALRFPNLRAFQLRNAVVTERSMMSSLYLLDYSKVYVHNRIVEEDGDNDLGTSTYLDSSGLEFLEAHPNLRCLAWQMDSFFSQKPLRSDIAERVGAVIDNLGRTLVDLRVDTKHSGLGENISESYDCSDQQARERRRRFIEDFAAKMSKVESIKIEGGIPRDERREVIRALHKCPLKKIVMIGVCCPIANTWGAAGRDLNETFDRAKLECLEAEHKDATHSLGFKKPDPPAANFRFDPTYGWPPGPPMIHTIGSFHAANVRELKFCGYKGAPVLFTPTPITNPMLAALKHFHKLESLILSMWLNTEFEESHRDSDIIQYWLDARSPKSTSLVRITDEEPEGWERELRTKYAPDALAWYITSFIGQFLSEGAKARKGGVHVRVCMCIGDWGGLFDIDLRIGKGSLNSDICLGYRGPREELEPDKRKAKLEARRWF